MGGVAVLVLSGCSSPQPVAEVPPPPELTPGGCGLAYEWLAPGQMGQLLDYEALPSLHKTATTIDSTLAVVGYGSLSPVPYGAQSYRLRYTTQDRGREVEATGMVVLPWDEEGPRVRAPMLLALHGTTGFNGMCAPSAPLLQADAATLFSVIAAQGWIVIAPDFIGLDAEADLDEPPDPRHAYLGAEQVAVGSLDMLRAAERMIEAEPEATATASRELLLWGGSQGGHAVFAAELYAPYYAWDYKVRAAVALVPATDLLGLSRYGLGQLGATSAGLAASMISLDRWYSDGSHAEVLLTNEPPSHFASALPEAMDQGCSVDLFDGVSELSEVFQPDALAAAAGDGLEALPPFGCYAAENSFSTISIERHTDTPFLFVTAENDDLIITSVEHDDFTRLCERGYHLEYIECADAEHVEGITWSLPEQLRWLSAHQHGEAIAAEKTCLRGPPVACEAQP